MITFSVHRPPDTAGDEAAESACFVKEGFCWPAFFVPVLWLLWHRHWLVLAGYLAAVASLILLGRSISDMALVALAGTFSVWFAFEANNLRRWALERRNWVEIGASHGRSRAEAEIRFFLQRAQRNGNDRPVSEGAADRPAREGVRVGMEDEPVFGLFPETRR